MNIVHGYGSKGHTRTKSFIPKDPTLGCDRARLSSLSSLVSFHTYISRKSHFGKTRENLCNSYGTYVFWHLKREQILCPNKLFHAFTDVFELNDPEIKKHYK